MGDGDVTPLEGARSSLSGRPDAELVARVADGDEAALGDLYDRHGDAVFRVAYRWLGDRGLAEEVMQEAFLALWNRAELFDPARGSAIAWLSTIARNRALDRLRALGRRPPPAPLSSILDDEGREERFLDRGLTSAAVLGRTEDEHDPERVLDAAWLRAEVARALETLPEVERRVIQLAYYEELTQSEIGTRTGWPLGTVKTRTRRALSRLRLVLAEALGPDLALRFVPAPVASSRAGSATLAASPANSVGRHTDREVVDEPR